MGPRTRSDQLPVASFISSAVTAQVRRVGGRRFGCAVTSDPTAGGAITGAHLVSLVRAGAKFESGVLVEPGTVAA